MHDARQRRVRWRRVLDGHRVHHLAVDAAEQVDQRTVVGHPPLERLAAWEGGGGGGDGSEVVVVVMVRWMA
jgi:hypothetical protein